MKKIKIIIILLVIALGITGGMKVFSNRKEKERVTSQEPEEKKENPIYNDKDTNKENNEEEIKTDEEPSEENKPDEEKKEPEKPVEPSNTTQTKPNNQQKPSVPTVPVKPDDKPSVKPEEPTKPEEKLEDLIIDNTLITNGTYYLSNKKYNTVSIASDIESHAKIVLDKVEIKQELIIENPGKYQIDILNSSIPNMVVANIKRNNLFSFFRTVKNINKTLEGATINVTDSEIKNLSINSNVEINGTNPVTNIEVNNSSEVILNIKSQNVLLNTTGHVALNQNIDTLINQKKATIVVNAPIETFTNHEESTIRINGENKITNLNNKGENTIIAGTGTITNATIEANNTRIYTNVTNKNVSDQVEQLLIRQEESVRIVEAYSNAQGSVTFTLSEEIELTLKDLSVICNAGKSITLFNLTTKDKKTYTLSTSYYKNDSYALYLTLPNGNIISKEFDTDYANPTVENVKIERLTETEAVLKLYGVDEGGKIYYILDNAKERITLDEETIKKNGQVANVKVGFNSLPINGLVSSESYQLYYVIEGYFENVSKVKGPITIPSQPKEENPSDYEIIYAKEEISNRFVFKLNRVPERELTLEDFQIDCPSDSSLTIKEATFYVSPDLLTYIIVIPDNYGHKDNEYTVRIKIDENEKAIEKDFATHLNPPVITGAVDNVKRVSETEAEFKFNSDEAGTVYYGLYEWNGGIYDYNSTTPFASDVLTGKIKSQKQTLNTGSNTIHLDLSKSEVTKNTRVWALFVDTVGNYRVGFVDHYKIPEYEKPAPPSESSLQITNIDYTNKSLKIEFNEELLYNITQDDVTISIVNGGSLPAKLMFMINNMEAKKVTIEIQNYVLPVGEYEIAIMATDKNNKTVRLTKTIEITN